MNVVCQLLAPSEWDATGVLRAMSMAYGGGFMKHGLRPRFVELDDPRAEAKLAAALADPAVKLVYSVGSWGVETGSDEKDKTPGLIERSGKPFLGHHGDYPFSPWVAKRLKHDFERRVTLYHDPYSPEIARHMIGKPRGVHGHATQAYCDVGYDPRRTATPASRRPIPLLYVGKHLTTDAARQMLMRGKPAPEFIPLFDAICERGFGEYRRSLIDVAKDVHGLLRMPFTPERARTSWMLYYAYEAILSRRRAGLLERLARHPLHLVIGGDGALPAQHPQSVVHKQKPFIEVLKMLDQARAAIVVQPNFSHALTERTLTAMQRGVVVLSTPNAFLDEHFVDGEDYIRIDGSWSDLDEKIASLADAKRTDAIAEAAWRKVTKRFSPEATVARYVDFVVPAAKAAQ